MASAPSLSGVGVSLVAPTLTSTPISGAAVVSNIFRTNVTATFGAVTALIGITATATVTGLLTTDVVHVSCTGALNTGVNIANARVSATNVLELGLTTAIATGSTLGALSYAIVVYR